RFRYCRTRRCRRWYGVPVLQIQRTDSDGSPRWSLSSFLSPGAARTQRCERRDPEIANPLSPALARAQPKSKLSGGFADRAAAKRQVPGRVLAAGAKGILQFDSRDHPRGPICRKNTCRHLRQDRRCLSVWRTRRTRDSLGIELERVRPGGGGRSCDRSSAQRNGGSRLTAFRTLNDIFFIAVDRDLPRVMSYETAGVWHDISSRELYMRVIRTARQLQHWGIAKGDRVALIAENRF